MKSSKQNEAGQRLTEFCHENALVIANTLFQQLRRRLYTWSSPNGQYQNQTYYIPCSWRWRSCIQLAKTRPGADCGSDHQLFIAKFRLKWKKRGETTRTARHNWNQIPYENAVEVMTAAAAAAASLQSCLTLRDPIDGSPPGSPVPGTLQARTLEWVAISFSRGSSYPRDWTRFSRISGRHFTIWATREAHLKGRRPKGRRPLEGKWRTEPWIQVMGLIDLRCLPRPAHLPPMHGHAGQRLTLPHCLHFPSCRRLCTQWWRTKFCGKTKVNEYISICKLQNSFSFKCFKSRESHEQSFKPILAQKQVCACVICLTINTNPLGKTKLSLHLWWSFMFAETISHAFSLQLPGDKCL